MHPRIPASSLARSLEDEPPTIIMTACNAYLFLRGCESGAHRRVARGRSPVKEEDTGMSGREVRESRNRFEALTTKRPVPIVDISSIHINLMEMEASEQNFLPMRSPEQRHRYVPRDVLRI